MWVEYRPPLLRETSKWYGPATQLCLLFTGIGRLNSSSLMSSTRIFTSFSSLCLPGIAGIIDALLMKDRFNSEILIWGWHGYLYIIGELKGRKFDFHQNIKELIFLFLVLLVSPDLSLSISTESRTPGLDVFLKNKKENQSRHLGKNDVTWFYL